MRYLYGLICLFFLCISTGQAETINGWYASLFGGYAYVPNYALGFVFNDITYKPGYDIGGSIGIQHNAARYAGELFYINADLKRFTQYYIPQTNISGGSDATIAMASMYYDFNGLISYVKPYIGGGIGYGWVSTNLTSLESGVNKYSSQGFAYQAAIGLDYDLSKQTTVNLSYRYIATSQSNALNGPFRPYLQSFLLNLGVIYRFDGCLVLCS